MGGYVRDHYYLIMKFSFQNINIYDSIVDFGYEGKLYGEFGWGGTTVICEHRRPKVETTGKETTC